MQLTAQDKAVLFDGLRVLCGYVENGTDTVVKIFQDDATKNWCVHVGKRCYYGEEFAETLAEAVEDNTTVEERQEIASKVANT